MLEDHFSSSFPFVGDVVQVSAEHFGRKLGIAASVKRIEAQAPYNGVSRKEMHGRVA